MYLSLLQSYVNDVNTIFSVITGDFNGKSSREWSLDKDNADGRKINFLSSACVFSQLINKPTIAAVKDKYIIRIHEKVNDPIIAPKTYWKIINRF